MATTPERLTKKYSSALYSYFRINNLAECYEKFSKKASYFPSFEYSSGSSLKNARRRLEDLKKELTNPKLSEADITFIDWRIAETRTLLKYWKIKKAPKTTQRMVSNYLASQIELYGPADEAVFAGIIRYLQKIARRRGGDYLRAFQEIESLIGSYGEGELFEPSSETFRYYRELAHKTFPALIKTVEAIPDAEDYSTQEIMEYFEQALAVVGAAEKGWKVKKSKEGANVIISKYRNRVIVGGHYKPLSPLRLRQIILHEVGCHVQKSMAAGPDWHYTRFNENDEGLAIVLEQLLEPRFSHKRSLRYLAMSLALGLDGKKRNFREVYEILWRASYIVGKYNSDTAKKKAFYETSRVFRGGLPKVRGAVFIKDKIYLEGNMNIWKALEAKHLKQDDFRDLFIKRDSLEV